MLRASYPRQAASYGFSPLQLSSSGANICRGRVPQPLLLERNAGAFRAETYPRNPFRPAGIHASPAVGQEPPAAGAPPVRQEPGRPDSTLRSPPGVPNFLRVVIGRLPA